MHPNDVDRIANSEDPAQTAPDLGLQYTVCQDLSVQKLRIMMLVTILYLIH